MDVSSLISGPMNPPGAARRKRVHDDFEPHGTYAFDDGGNNGDAESGESTRRSSLIGMSGADVHSGFHASNVMKSRRIVSELGLMGGNQLEEPLHGSLAPLVGTGSPGPPVLMSEPLQNAHPPPNPFMTSAPSIASFSTSQLDNFRLDSGSLEQKETKARVLKPVAKRGLHGTPHSTPQLPPPLPSLSHYLPQHEHPRASTGSRQLSFPSFGKAFPNGPSPFSAWRVPSTTALMPKDGGLPAPTRSGPSTPAMTADVEPPVKSQVGIAFSATESDQCSSDEEFSMDHEISVSQDKLTNLSVHDIADHFLDGDEKNTPSPQVLMQLAPGFANMLGEQEEKKLKEIGAFTVALKVSPDPIILGRDHFYPVFGDKIRGCETFHLSRRHCVFHVARADSKDSSKQYKVVVENTSTNGLDVNGRPMKSLEQRELHVGDTVTLLKIRNHSGDISLAYTLVVNNPAPVQQKVKTMTPSRRSPRIARGKVSASKAHLARKPRLTGSSDPFALPFSPPRKKMKFPTIRAEILIADPFFAVSESPRQQSRGYRDELSAAMAALGPVERLVITSECATKEALFAAVQNSKRIFIYAGGSQSNRLLVEDQAGMPAHVDMAELSAAVGEEGSKPQLAIIFAKSVATAQAFVDAGIRHVIFVNSSSRTRLKSVGYLRSLFASLLKGSSIGEAHALARRTALGEGNAPSTPHDCLCGILPGGVSHDVYIGEQPKKLDSNLVRSSLPTLNALLIPSLPPYFFPQEEVISEVIGALRKGKVQICSLQGGKGVGKTSTSVYVAKYATERRWYKDGVHFFDVESAFTDGKDASSSSALGWTGEQIDSEDKRQRVTRRIQNEIEELLQLLHPKTPADTCSTTLVVLDGCDRLSTAEFRDFIVKTAQAYPTVQLLITMKQLMPINTHTKVVDENTVQLKALSTSDTATVFLSMAKACLDQERLSQALPSLSHEALAKHPAITRLNGIPLLLSRTVLELRTTKLDELQ